MADTIFIEYCGLPGTLDEYNNLDFEGRLQRLCAEELLTGVSANDRWYHYTSLSCLPQMLDQKSECVILRASHAQFVNDKEEFEYGINIISNSFKSISRKKIEERYKGSTFITCFSEHSDSVPMWNTYAEKGRGIALGFKPFISNSNSTQVIRVIYQGTPQEERWKEWLIELSTKKDDKLSRAAFLINVAYYPFAIKNGCFSYEKEIRLFTISNLDKFEFHLKNGIPVPHVDVPIPLEFLSEIKIGPTANQEKVKQSISMLLKARNIENVKISFSNQPLQD